MFIGRHNHHLEEKGRLSVPKKFRPQLENGAILSQGLDGCLFLYPKSAWMELIDKLNQMPLTRADSRNFLRSLSYGAVEVEIDSLGRILIPDYLKNFAQIKSDCVIAGAIERIEIWDMSTFEKFNTKINEQPKDFI
ncbi:division/cell wall cluster transcriptional repressor MraZ [Candidatus Amesbacteria bacterium]|nr:division/cell wall cluster transcriptional repressor MraZ [Candidatus Amesbacteria bacterium]